MLSDLREIPSGEVSEREAEAPWEDSELEKPGLSPFPPQMGQASWETRFSPSHRPTGTHFLVAYSRARQIISEEPLLTSLSQCESQTRSHMREAGTVKVLGVAQSW